MQGRMVFIQPYFTAKVSGYIAFNFFYIIVNFYRFHII